MLTPRDCPTFLAELQSLGQTDRERAAELGVLHAKTIERLRRRFPQGLRALLNEPRLLRALLTDLERQERNAA